MPEQWELTDENYDAIAERGPIDPETEEYDQAIAYAARRGLLSWLLDYHHLARPGGDFSDSVQELLRRHDLEANDG